MNKDTIKQALEEALSAGNNGDWQTAERLLNETIAALEAEQPASSNFEKLRREVIEENPWQFGDAIQPQAEQPASEEQPCVCGEISTLNTVHRKDGPCYVAPSASAAVQPQAEQPNDKTKIHWLELEVKRLREQIAAAPVQPASKPELSKVNAVEYLRDLTSALNSAFISTWQSTAAWQKQLDAANEFLEGK